MVLMTFKVRKKPFNHPLSFYVLLVIKNRKVGVKSRKASCWGFS